MRPPKLLPFMRRSQASSPSTTSLTKSLGLSSFHERHRILEEEHQWLLKQIKRKRSELKNFLDQMRSIATQIFQQATPLSQKLMALDAEIHRLFEEILTTKKLSKKSLKDITSLYNSLQLMGILSPKFDDDDELDEVFCDSSFDDFSAEPGDDFFNHNKNAHHSHQEHSDNLFQETQGKSPQSRQIRQTFLKLAALFHPDKVTDQETQMHHNEIMKEVNRAYQEGDIARLLEIEKQHHLQEDIDLKKTTKSEIERLCLQREKDNQLLKTQYENLKRELRISRKTPEGEIVKDYRACQKQGIDAVAEMILELESQVQQIENIRNFVRDFRDNKITIQEFLKGPMPDEEMLEMMLSQLLGVKF